MTITTIKRAFRLLRPLPVGVAAFLFMVGSLSADSNFANANPPSSGGFLYSQYLQQQTPAADLSAAFTANAATDFARVRTDITDSLEQKIEDTLAPSRVLKHLIDGDPLSAAFQNWDTQARLAGWDIADIATQGALSAFAGTDGRWIRNAEIDLRSELGGRSANVGVHIIGALRETDSDALAWQLRGFAAEDGQGANAGLIYRRATGNQLFGVNAFLDYETHDAENFWRWSLGGETRSPWLDIFANYYVAITDDATYGTGGAVSVLRNVYSADGYDLAARLHSPDLPWLSGVLSYYAFEGKYGQEDDDGFRVGLELSPPQTSGLKLEAVYDSGDEGNNFGGAISYLHNIGSANQSTAARNATFVAQDYFFAPAEREHTQRLRETGTRNTVLHVTATLSFTGDVGDNIVVVETSGGTPTTTTIDVVTNRQSHAVMVNASDDSPAELQTNLGGKSVTITYSGRTIVVGSSVSFSPNTMTLRYGGVSVNIITIANGETDAPMYQVVALSVATVSFRGEGQMMFGSQQNQGDTQTVSLTVGRGGADLNVGPVSATIAVGSSVAINNEDQQGGAGGNNQKTVNISVRSGTIAVRLNSTATLRLDEGDLVGLFEADPDTPAFQPKAGSPQLEDIAGRTITAEPTPPSQGSGNPFHDSVRENIYQGRGWLLGLFDDIDFESAPGVNVDFINEAVPYPNDPRRGRGILLRVTVSLDAPERSAEGVELGRLLFFDGDPDNAVPVHQVGSIAVEMAGRGGGPDRYWRARTITVDGGFQHVNWSETDTNPPIIEYDDRDSSFSITEIDKGFLANGRGDSVVHVEAFYIAKGNTFVRLRIEAVIIRPFVAAIEDSSFFPAGQDGTRDNPFILPSRISGQSGSDYPILTLASTGGNFASATRNVRGGSWDSPPYYIALHNNNVGAPVFADLNNLINDGVNAVSLRNIVTASDTVQDWEGEDQNNGYGYHNTLFYNPLNLEDGLSFHFTYVARNVRFPDETDTLTVYMSVAAPLLVSSSLAEREDDNLNVDHPFYFVPAGSSGQALATVSSQDDYTYTEVGDNPNLSIDSSGVITFTGQNPANSVNHLITIEGVSANYTQTLTVGFFVQAPLRIRQQRPATLPTRNGFIIAGPGSEDEPLLTLEVTSDGTAWTFTPRAFSLVDDLPAAALLQVTQNNTGDDLVVRLPDFEDYGDYVDETSGELTLFLRVTVRNESNNPQEQQSVTSSVTVIYTGPLQLTIDTIHPERTGSQATDENPDFFISFPYFQRFLSSAPLMTVTRIHGQGDVSYTGTTDDLLSLVVSPDGVVSYASVQSDPPNAYSMDYQIVIEGTDDRQTQTLTLDLFVQTPLTANLVVADGLQEEGGMYLLDSSHVGATVATLVADGGTGDWAPTGRAQAQNDGLPAAGGLRLTVQAGIYLVILAEFVDNDGNDGNYDDYTDSSGNLDLSMEVTVTEDAEQEPQRPQAHISFRYKSGNGGGGDPPIVIPTAH